MPRLLVIDDENLIRMLTREAGEALGYEVLSASSLREGRALLDADAAAGRSLDLVLLDVMLPDGDGLAEMDRLTKGPGHPDVIVITGHGNAAAAEAALSAGAWDYLGKPLRLRVQHPEFLLERVHAEQPEFLRVHRPGDQLCR